MPKKHINITIIIIVFSIIVLQMFFNTAYAENILKDGITHGSKIIFFKTETGSINATIIPYSSSGSYPRSGWITCDIIAVDIIKALSEKLKNKNKFEDYFTATYKKINIDKNSPILIYKGELLKIEPWNPPFIKNSK